jgi:hypothetical protein
MRFRAFVLSVLVFAGVGQTTAFQNNSNLRFGTIYGSAGFVLSDSSSEASDAPHVILAFERGGRRAFVLTDDIGDFVAVVQPGRYCLIAYSRAGKPLLLAKNQLKCVAVSAGGDVRLDVIMIVPRFPR